MNKFYIPHKKTKHNFLFFRYVTASKMLLLCRGLQKITTYNQTGKMTECVTSLCTSMDRKFHRMEYNTVLSKTSVLDPRFKSWPFMTTELLRAVPHHHHQQQQDAPSAASQLSHQEAKREQVHQCQKRLLFGATEETASRNPSADAMLEVRSYLEEPHIQRALQTR